MGDWVVTPRRGKAVEINALWYNALRLLAGWLAERATARTPSRLREAADRAARNRSTSVSGAASADGCSTSSMGPAATTRRCGRINSGDFLAPSGARAPIAGRRSSTSSSGGCSRRSDLRSLAPGEPDYKPRYDGDLRARDAAYHQGTVWAWLIGPFIDAWLKTHPHEFERARAISERIFRPLRRSLRRLDQRSLRRRNALHSARMCRPGLERRGSATLLGPHRPGYPTIIPLIDCWKNKRGEKPLGLSPLSLVADSSSFLAACGSVLLRFLTAVARSVVRAIAVADPRSMGRLAAQFINLLLQLGNLLP